MAAFLAAQAAQRGPPLIGVGVTPDKEYKHTEWAKGVRNWNKGPWKLTDNKVVANWGVDPATVAPAAGLTQAQARAAAIAQSYTARHSNVMIELDWGNGISTKFHLKQTKLLDVQHTIAIPTDRHMKKNKASHFGSEWEAKADGVPGAAGTMSAMLLAAPRLGPFGKISVPRGLNANVTGHILVNSDKLFPMDKAGTAITGITPAGLNRDQRANFHLRRWYYIALEEGRRPTALPAAIRGLANTMTGTVPLPNWKLAPARSIALPLVAAKQFGYERAAEQACQAFVEYFNPTGPESVVLGLPLPAGGIPAGGLAALKAARRAHYTDIILTFPNGTGASSNPQQRPPMGAAFVTNIWGKDMGQQELAWTQAMFTYLRCPSCMSGVLDRMP